MTDQDETRHSDRNPPETGETPERPDFEESLAELQQIVEALEGGELGLEESMQRFETGIALLRHCYRTLEEAEQKIEILTGTDADGNPVLERFDATATHDSQQSSSGRQRRQTKPPDEPQASAEPPRPAQDDGGADEPAEDDPRKRLF